VYVIVTSIVSLLKDGFVLALLPLINIYYYFERLGYLLICFDSLLEFVDFFYCYQVKLILRLKLTRQSSDRLVSINSFMNGRLQCSERAMEKKVESCFLALAGEADAENEGGRQPSQRSRAEAHTRNSPTAQGNPHSVFRIPLRICISLFAFRCTWSIIETKRNRHLKLIYCVLSSFCPRLIG